MSRGITFAILAVLLGCLGVMSFVLNPKNPNDQAAPASSKEQTAEQQRKAKEMQDTMRKEMMDRQKRMHETAVAKTPATKHVDKGDAGNAKAAAPEPPKRQYNQIFIEKDWYLKRPSGEQGVVALQKEQAELKKEFDAQRKANADKHPSIPTDKKMSISTDK